MEEPESAHLGERLRAAAKAAGLSSNQLGRQLGFSGAAIRAWWEGRNRPKPDKLVEYANLVGVPVEVLVTGAAEAMPASSLVDSILDWLNVIQRGANPVEAFSELGADVSEFAPAVRQALLDAEPKIRADLAALGGEDWQSLTEEQRRAIAAQIRSFAAANRRQRQEG